MFDEYGSQAWDLALFAARVDAISALTLPIGKCLAIVLTSYVIYRLFKKTKEEIIRRLEKESTGLDYYDEPVLAFASFFQITFRILSLGFLGPLVYNLFNTWAWVGIFVPEVWIIKQALGW